VKASKALDVPVADRAAIALVIGYDHRVGVESAGPSRSDTLMLIRADPQTKTISLLSFPRDLRVPIYCGATPSATDRINAAYAYCKRIYPRKSGSPTAWNRMAFGSKTSPATNAAAAA